jgi:toxin ParE1/3/4
VKHVIRPAARQDIIRQYRYYLVDQEVPEVAMRFIEATQETIATICRMPEIGVQKLLGNNALRSLRSWPVNNFEDIRIYYLIQDNLLRVVRVLHGKRDVGKILTDAAREGLLN